MSDELLPCWDCGRPPKIFGEFKECVNYHCPNGFVALDARRWDLRARQVHDLRQRAEKAEAENERLRAALDAIVLNSTRCEQCSASYIASKALGGGE